ncbi:hypothetical protein ACPUER_35765 [Burkholderia sp. DN3021]|uniref:hypothetical protein n=1 Tax=Burkholderia sp. DN3021 TaxID=3410137 RepID=UPI003C7A2E19
MRVDFSKSYPAKGIDALIHEMKAACDERLIDKTQFAELATGNFAGVANTYNPDVDTAIALMQNMRTACDEGFINEPQFASYQAQFVEAMVKHMPINLFECGYAGMITDFIRKVKGCCSEGLLNNVLFSEIIAAQGRDGWRGVHYALAGGQTGTVKAYISEIKAAHAEGYINDEQCASLIVAKTPKGEPGWSVSLKYARTDTADAYIQEVGPLVGKGIVSRSALEVQSVPKEKVPASLIGFVRKG